MKILHLVSSAGQYGAETMLLELATALKDAGCDLVLGVFENQHSRNTQIHKSAIERGLDSRLISCSGRIDQKAVKEVRSLLQGNEIDVLHSHGYKSNLYGYLAARKANIPLVTTCHGWPGGTLALSCYYILDKVILHRFDRIIAVSESLVRSLRWAAIPNQRINCIPNGVTQVASHRCLSDEASQLPSTKRIDRKSVV